MDRPTTISPFAHPLYVMLKPVGAQCNLRCQYCYYLDKASFYGDFPMPRMTEQTLELFTKEYIGVQTQREVFFLWHGGEPLLQPLSFYQHAVALQRKYCCGHVISNSIQTNGTLLTEEWCRFLKENNWLVGLSIDGPSQLHDTYRRDRGGGATHHRVMRAVEMLNRHGVEWNAMAVVNRVNAEQPHAFYQFFKDIGCHYIQFTPIVEPDPQGVNTVTAESVTPSQWGEFLCQVFDEWVAEDVGTYFVQLFDATLANWVGVEPGVCSMSRSCGNALVMEYNGDVYSCDHYVFPQYRLGNIHEVPLATLAFSEEQHAFRCKKTLLPTQCMECEYEFACRGECPKNRLVDTSEGETRLNYLCSGYRQFFSHVAPYMEHTASLIRPRTGLSRDL